MNSDVQDNYILTNEDIAFLRCAQQRLAEAEVHAQPKVAPEGVSVYPTLIPSLLTRARLSDATRVAEERRLAKQEKKRKALRAPKKRARGQYHWARKAATKRRYKAKLWAEQPFGCLLAGYGYKKLDKSLWDLHIAPLWSQYRPADLMVKWSRSAGTRDDPKSVYNLRVVHKQLGELYNGNDLLLYHLSSPGPAASL